MHYFLFRPATVVVRIAVASADECAVSAVGRLDECDIRIAQDPFARLGPQANERVVGGMNDQRGDGDPVDYVRGSGSGVVIICAGESTVVGRDPVIELAQASDSAQAG